MSKEQVNEWIIKILSGFSVLTISLVAWFFIRMVNNYDTAVDNQDVIKQQLNDIKGSIIGISGRIDITNVKLDKAVEIEALHYYEVQKLQKKIYND